MKRIIIIGPSNIGDGVLVMDVIAAVCRTYPDAQIGLVVGERASMLFDQDERIHRLWAIDTFEGALGRIKLLIELMQYRAEACVDLRGTAFPLLLAPKVFWRYLKQPPKRIVHMHKRHLWKLSHQLPEAAASMDKKDKPSLWQSASDTERVNQLWSRWRLSSALPVIVICPGARSHIKRWTVEGFAQVADRLIEEHEAQIIFSGEIAEKGVIDDVMELMTKPAYSAVGMLTVRQLAWVMHRATLVITNDSASLHLASNVSTPTVAIFGPTDATQYGPIAPHHQVLRRQLFCSPCKVALCAYNHECMRYISADEVYAAADTLLHEVERV